MFKSENGMSFLEEGDVFTVDYYKSSPSKNYPDRMIGKILTTEGEEIFTSAAKIVKVLDELTKDDDISDLSKYALEVVKAGEFNGRAVLSLKSDNPLIKKKIKRILF